MDPKLLEGYAKLIVELGLNPSPDQEVFILSGVEQMDFLALVVEQCYRRGVRRVVTRLEDVRLARLDQLYRSEAGLSQVDAWELELLKWRSSQLPAMLWLDSDDPDGMSDVDQGKKARAQMARFPVIKPYRDAMENRHQWCIAGVPGRAWARKVFPGLPDAAAMEKLWCAILTAARADGDPLTAWQEHNAQLHRRAAQLNEWHFTALEYHSPNGTNFTVGLMPESRFAGGSERDLSGREFNPNLPSEEIFTTPRCGAAEGVLVATRPLSWQGTLIEDFSLRFAGGRVTEIQARKGREALERLIAMDEGAARLGECALIPEDSPINRLGVLFYNTLYDENASCHLALGRGFNDCVTGYEQLTPEELRRLGVNDSMVHVDFMVGGPELDVTGITPDGRRVAVFRKGAWCF